MGLTELIHALRNPPEQLTGVCAGREVYLVGGYLRDRWLGRPSFDIDLAVGGDFHDALAELATRFGGEFFELSERYGSWRLVSGDWIVDASPLHSDGIIADLARRDYTVNTLACRLDRLGSFADDSAVLSSPGASADIDQRILRAVSMDNLADDPLRIMRGYRLAATLGLTPDADTRGAWKQLSGRVTESAGERIREELLRWFSADADIAESLAWAAEDEVLFTLLPELSDSRGCTQNEYHHLDVWSHTLEAIAALWDLCTTLPPELQSFSDALRADLASSFSPFASCFGLTRFALLLHDVAKPATRAVREDGHVTFYNHQDVGALMLEPRLKDLRFSSDEIDFIALMIRQHLRLGFYSAHNPLAPKLVYRYIRELGPATPLMILHSIADCLATRGRLNDDSLAAHLRAGRQILAHYYAGDAVARPPVLLDGDAIMTLLEIGPGKDVGALKDALLEATAEGEVTSVDEAEQFLRRMRRDPGQS